MKRWILATVTAALPAFGLSAGTAAEPCAGLYRLQVSQESRSLAKLSGKPEPSSTLKLAPDHTFLLESQLGDAPTKKTGKYSVENGTVNLSLAENEALQAKLGDNALTLGGLTYVRVAQTSLLGCWTVHKNGLEDKSIRITFNKDGTFLFSAWNASSSGKYELTDGHLVLLWTKIDDDKVELGSIKKDINLGVDGTSFNIDTFRYERKSE